MAEPRPFSWIVTAIGGGIINFVINAPIGWFMVPAGGTLGVWTVPGIAPDVVITAYGIAFGTSLVVTPQTRKQVARGQMLPPPMTDRWLQYFGRWPNLWWLRSMNLGIVSATLFAPLPLLALYLTHAQPFDRMSAMLLKGGFSFIVGAVVSPIIAAAATVPVKS